MSRFHPSWPSPLLALDPIRLRPMGWLDDLLPMRPPSLWRDRSLYARALRWQPDMADLSWLFDAYAMLGIEMPPTRIEHRTHQRSPQRGRLKGNARQTQLRRRRAPIKGASRPLAIPRWSSPPQMVAPVRTETQDRVDNAPSFRARRTVAPQSLAKVEWRSPDRTAPTPTLARATGTQVTPSLGVQPTLLRKANLSEEGRQQNQTEIPLPDRTQSTVPRGVESERTVPKSQRQPEVLASRKPKIQRFPAVESTVSRREGLSISESESTPPPKVTWQQRHTRSPWRLNQTGRTLFKPQAGPSSRLNVPDIENRRISVQTQKTQPVQKHFSEQITRLGRLIQTQEETVITEGTSRPFRFRPVVKQVEWSPVRKGFIRDAVQEQGVVRTVTPTVQMELPPSPRGEPEASSVSKPSVPVPPEKDVSPSPNREITSRSVEPSPKTKAAISVEPVVLQAGRARLQRQRMQRARRIAVEETVPQFQKPIAKSMVQVPNRVPWRLKPSIPSETTRVQRRIEPDESVNSVSKRTVTPVAQQTFTPKRRDIPLVESWFPPQRQRLIEHFQRRRNTRLLDRSTVETVVNRSVQRDESIDTVSPLKKRLESSAISSMGAPSYNFASTGSASQSVFRVQDQTMVAPLRAGTLVFPTPAPSTQTKQVLPSSSDEDTSVHTGSKTSASNTPEQAVKTRDTSDVSESKTKRRSIPSEQFEERKSIKQGEELSSDQTRIKKVVTPSSSGLNTASTTQKVEVQSIDKLAKKPYPEPFVQEDSVYQRRSLRASTAFWTLPKRRMTERNTSPVTRLIQDKSTQRRWRLPYVPFSTGDIEVKSTSTPPTPTPKSLSTMKSVFRAPSTFWQGTFVQGQGRGSIQLQPPMVYTTPSIEMDSGTRRVDSAKPTESARSPVSVQPAEKSDTRWLPKQVVDANVSPVKSKRGMSNRATSEKKRSLTQQRRAVPSVSWRRKPTFPDPFLAQRQAITFQQATEKTSVTPMMSSSEPESLLSRPSSGASQIVPVAQNKPTVSEVEWVQSKRDAGPVSRTSTTRSKGALQVPQTGLTSIRRVVAPTLSAAIVYNSTTVDQSIQQGQRSTGKYSQSSSQPSLNRDDTSPKDPSTRAKSVGKYGPKSSESPSPNSDNPINVPGTLSPSVSAASQVSASQQKVVGKYSATGQDGSIHRDKTYQVREDIQETTQGKVEVPRVPLNEDLRGNADINVVAEQVVQKTVRRLVRRLPSTQQALLRSRISLPTNWARKLGLAPTAEVKLGWRLQRTMNSSIPSSGIVSTPSMPSGSHQFVIPSGDSSEESAKVSRIQETESESISKKNRTGTSRPEVSQPSSRRLSSAQINRIIERQVSFYRSAQRQSFLKASQMTEGSSSVSVPAPARGGLQQVTGEMRKALQRMVFSSESQPIFLDSIPDIDAVMDRSSKATGGKETTVAPKVPKTQTVKRPTRLGVRTPQWRPGIHTPSPVARYGQRTSSQRGRGTSRIDSAQETVSGSAVAPGSSIVPNAAPMTMLEREETTSVSDRPTSVQSSDTAATVQSSNRQKTEQATLTTRKKVSRGRSPTVAPLSLMGRSDVGVFLQPKRKSPEPEEVSSKPISQSAESVDSESDVFMVDATGNLLTGEKATKRLKELGFARAESTKPKTSSTMDTSSGSYTWEAPADLMEEAVKQVRKEMVQEKIKESPSSAPHSVRQSVIKEWTEEQLLTILVELASSSPEANALLRDVQERVEEYFDLERFRKI